MNVNVYLPDELGRQAKEADLPFSQLLRDAVVQELKRKANMTTTAPTYDTIIDLEDEKGQPYKGRIGGRLIGSDLRWNVFYTTDLRVILYDRDEKTYKEVGDPVADLRFLPPGVYMPAMFAIGKSPIVDL